MITTLTSTIPKFKTAIHLADVHIHLNKRNEEYRTAFRSFYSELDSADDSTLVVIAGDVFHNKVDLSPESIQLCREFLVNVADRKPTILITGNHDCLLSCSNRLDSLTPVVEAINHPNLHYLRTSGLYAIGDVLFNVMSVLSSQYIPGTQIPAIYRNKYRHIIGLYHGTVDSVVNDLGYIITNKEVDCSTFDGHHIVMLGDIHKAQTIQQFDDSESVVKPIIRYPGSFLQQNHGESLSNHGYTLWDLPTRSYAHKDIPNEYGYFTIDIDNGKLVTDVKGIPKKARLRVRCVESVVSEVKAVMTHVHGLTDVEEVVYERVMSEDDKHSLIITNKDIDLSNVGQLDHQETLLTKYLKNKLGLEDEDKIAAVLGVNKEMNDSISVDLSGGGLRWKPKLFEWDNMFSYGEDNVIDFTKLRGLYGLFAPNRSGKSAIMSALSFCIFDKCDRTSLASEVMNTHKSTFSCRFNFEIDGVDYFIERKGTSDRKGNVKVDTNFWKVENDVKVELNGERRSETNDQIRKYMGTYEDFVLTSLSVQNVKNSTSFIDVGNTERKDILSQFLGIGIFDKLHEQASARLNELSVLTKSFDKTEESRRHAELMRVRDQLVELDTTQEKEKSRLIVELDKINENIVSATSRLIKLDESVGNWTEEQIRKSLSDIVKQRKSLISDFEDRKTSILQGLPAIHEIIKEKTDELADIETQISAIEKRNISESYRTYQSSLAEYNRSKNELDRLELTIRNLEEKMDHLSQHEYDPDCPYCVKNADATGKESVKTRKLLVESKSKLVKLTEQVAKHKTDYEGSEWVVKEQESFTGLLSSRNRIKDSITLARNKIAESDKILLQQEKSVESQVRQFDENTTLWNDRLAKFVANKESIKSNFDVQVLISSHRAQLKVAQDSLKNVDRSLMETNKRLGMAKTEIESIEEKIKRVESTEKSQEAFQYYVKCVCRDGIPYELICGAVPEIDREVNIILNQITDFHAKFETDGKNIIPYISSGDGTSKWTMRLSSGFEKFVLGLAIRVALINLSNLPRPNFIMIDEGWGTADAENLANVPPLLSFLRTSFDFLLIISHLDTMKDMVDGTIDIVKEGEFSKVRFE